jgi:hypothetical protein
MRPQSARGGVDYSAVKVMGIVVTLVVAVVASLIGAVIWFRVRPYLQADQEARQEERMLQAFLELATEANPHQKLMVAVYAPKAADQDRLLPPFELRLLAQPQQIGHKALPQPAC